MKNICFITTTEGCATNLLENASYRKSVAGTSEYHSVVDPAEADIIVVNTCAYTTSQEDRSLSIISELKQKYPNKEVIVGGCLTKINPDSLGQVHDGFSFEPAQYTKLTDYLGVKSEKIEEASFFDDIDFVDLSWVHRLVLKIRPLFKKVTSTLGVQLPQLNNILETSIVNTKYYGVTVSTGCAGKCTFCAIKNAKGYVVSKKREDIVAQIKGAIDKGFDKFWLLGDDIGCYGIDHGDNFPNLLKDILAIEKDFKLIINYFEPYFFLKYYDELEKCLQDPRVVNFNLPIQSGNALVVRKMGREYDPKEVLERVSRLKKKSPNLVIKTNIITSFPHETWRAFWDSVKSVFFFDAVLAIDYTSRPGTGAEKYKNHHGEFVKKVRHKIINIFIVLRHLFVFSKSLVGVKLK